MSARVDVAVLCVLLGRACPRHHVPQVAVGVTFVAVARDEVVLGQLEDDGDEPEELVDDVLVDVAVELLDLGVVLPDHSWVGAFILRDELEDVV